MFESDHSITRACIVCMTGFFRRVPSFIKVATRKED